MKIDKSIFQKMIPICNFGRKALICLDESSGLLVAMD